MEMTNKIEQKELAQFIMKQIEKYRLSIPDHMTILQFIHEKKDELENIQRIVYDIEYFEDHVDEVVHTIFRYGNKANNDVFMIQTLRLLQDQTNPEKTKFYRKEFTVKFFTERLDDLILNIVSYIELIFDFYKDTDVIKGLPQTVLEDLYKQASRNKKKEENGLPCAIDWNEWYDRLYNDPYAIAIAIVQEMVEHPEKTKCEIYPKFLREAIHILNEGYNFMSLEDNLNVLKKGNIDHEINYKNKIVVLSYKEKYIFVSLRKRE